MMADDEVNSNSLASSKLGNSLTTVLPEKATVVSTVTAPGSGVSSFQIRQNFISPTGLHLANNAVVLPVQGLTTQTGISQGNAVQIPKSGVPVLGANAVSGQLTFQTPVSPTAFQQTIPLSQGVSVTSTLVGQPVTLQKGQQVTVQRGPQVTFQGAQQVTLQRFQSKGQPMTVQRFPAVLPASIQHVQYAGTSSNLGKVQLARQVLTQANNTLQLSTKPSTGSALGHGQNHQSNLRIPSPIGHQVTVQRIISPVVGQPNSGVSVSQIVPGAVNQSIASNLQNELPVGAASIIPGQITIQPRPPGSLIAGSASTPITLTVTSISPSSAVISSSSPTVPVITHSSASQVQQPFIQRPSVVISQPSVIRAGIPVVLPRSTLTLAGRQQVLQGTLQRLIQRPLVSQTSNCGGQVTVQIPHIVGPLIKMPNFKPSTASTTVTTLPKDSLSQKAPPIVCNNIVTCASSTSVTTTSATVISTPLTSVQPTPVTLTVVNSTSQPTSTLAVSADMTTSVVIATDSLPLSQPSVLTPTSSANDKGDCGNLANGRVSCVTSTEPNKVNSISTLNTESKESSKEEVVNGGNLGQKTSAENSEAVKSTALAATSTSQNAVGKETTSVGKTDMSTISVLPNSLSSLRQQKNRSHSPAIRESSPKHESDKTSGMILTEGFIDSNLLDWDDKVGTLPGTEMKFKINEFGDLELLEDGENEKVNNVPVGDSKDEEKKIMPGDGDDNGWKREGFAVNDPSELSEREGDPICCCLYCGSYGYKSNFRASGQFCSQTCDTKKNMHRKQLLMSRMMEGEKKNPKKLSMPGESASISPSEGTTVLDKSHIAFDWDKYLADTGSIGAPKRLFKEAIPSSRNGFKLGMRLEGVDPKHQALFCVLSVSEIQGYRLRLHFDGYSECYDFWINADSPFIFPVGWAEKNGKTLQPPKNMSTSEFNWTSYLKRTRAIAAPKHLFLNQPSTVTPSAFRVGMKLEVVDQKKSERYYVATVADTNGERILIHFDGCEDVYDFWCDNTSSNIRPVGWCRQNHKKRLIAPPDYGDAENFMWENYLSDTKSTAVPSRAFKPRNPVGFEVGMKVEVMDKRNPILIRVATVKKVKNTRLLIHFDGWDDDYNYWIEDDYPDIHPPMWCTKTGHRLQGPIDKKVLKQEESSGGCPTLGCTGIGHIKGAKYTGHHSDFGCPYSAINMSKDTCLADRLGSSRSEEGAFGFIRQEYHGDVRRCPTPGCNGLGHVTGKFTSHHCLSGCPLAEKFLQKNKDMGAESRPVGRPSRGRKRKLMGYGFGPHEKRIKEEDVDGSYEEASMFRASVHESVFQSMAIYPPVRDQPLGWSDHTKLLPAVFSIDSSMVDKWSAEQVADFIQTLTGKEEQAQRFKEEEIDGDSFLLLQQSDLVNFLNIKLGPAVKIFNSIQVLKAGLETI